MLFGIVLRLVALRATHGIRPAFNQILSSTLYGCDVGSSPTGNESCLSIRVLYSHLRAKVLRKHRRLSSGWHGFDSRWRDFMSKRSKKNVADFQNSAFKWSLPIVAFNFFLWKHEGRYLNKKQARYLRESLALVKDLEKQGQYKVQYKGI